MAKMFGSPKTPAPPPPPPAVGEEGGPKPAPTRTDVEVQDAGAEARRKRMARGGRASTMLSSGDGSDVVTASTALLGK